MVMDVESGIRQGCNASTVLFKLVTYKIIKAVRRKLMGIDLGGVRVRCLFYADDELLLARSVEEAKEGINEVKRVAEYYGLEVNERKSECVFFNVREGVEVIEGMAVVKEIKYLGLKVQGKKNLFEGQRKVMVGKAKWLSTLMSGVVERSCHRVMVGKSFWKGVAIPRICLLYTSPSPRDKRQSRMPSSA